MKPQIRFKGFTDDWEQRELKSITSVITKGTTPLDKSNSGTVNFIKVENIDNSSGEISISQKISKEEHEGYLKRSQLQENDILFSIAGTLGRVTSVNSDILPANTNQALAIIRLKECNLDYIKTFLKSKAVTDYIKRNPTVGAQPNLSLEQVGNLEIQVPSLREQQAIGTYFRNLDNLITLHQRKCETLQKLKKSMLQKMFPKNGELYPEIRFAGFTDAWEQRKLNSIADVRDGTHASPQYFSSGHPFITSKNVKDGYINYDDVQFISDEDFEEINKRSKVDVNDILMGMIGTIGNLALVRETPDFAIKNVALIKDTGDIYYRYLYHCLQSEIVLNQLTENMDGGTQKFVALNRIRELHIPFPSKPEQEAIGTYFRNLDNLITLHQRKLETLKNLKKSMLQKMFT
ncbi:MAG: restriction endonuclease subunit S [Ruminococcus sp.]|nr:restriction endonuclease subunit S [Ruminococcus sp.]